MARPNKTVAVLVGALQGNSRGMTAHELQEDLQTSIRTIRWGLRILKRQGRLVVSANPRDLRVKSFRLIDPLEMV